MTAAWVRNRVYVCVYKCLQLTNSLENPLLLEAKDSHMNISLEMAIFYMRVLIPSSSSPFIKARQVSFLKLVSQDVIILLLQQISGLLGGCNLSSINSASSPNSVLLNSSQTLSSGSPALHCLRNAALGLGFCPTPRTAPVCTIAPSFLEDFCKIFCLVTQLCVQGANTELVLQNTNVSIPFFSFFCFCITSSKSGKLLAQSFPCLLGYSDEREWQS